VGRLLAVRLAGHTASPCNPQSTAPSAGASPPGVYVYATVRVLAAVVPAPQVNREKARLIDPALPPYDVLLDDYEKGCTSARLDEVFQTVSCG
jgi:hypothetical protein